MSSRVLKIVPACCGEPEVVFGPAEAFPTGAAWFCHQHGPTSVAEVRDPNAKGTEANAAGTSCLMLLTLSSVLVLLARAGVKATSPQGRAFALAQARD